MVNKNKITISEASKEVAIMLKTDEYSDSDIVSILMQKGLHFSEAVNVLVNESKKILKPKENPHEDMYYNMSEDARKFISKKIPILIHEGYHQKQAVRIAFEMARKVGYKVNPICPHTDEKEFHGPKLSNPGAKWHSEKAEKYYKQYSKYGNIGHLAKYSAHKESEDESKKLGINPPDGVMIYDTILAIEARKGKNSLWPKENFRHEFKNSSKAAVYGLPDGSILIKSQKGKKLWKVFNYGDEDL